jgi:hypothetical protein
MIEGYVDSVVPSFSDDEERPESRSVSRLRFDGERSKVNTVVLAAKPSSATIRHFACNSTHMGDIYMNERIVGRSFTLGQTGFACLDMELAVDLGEIFASFDRVIVLASRQGPQSQVRFISTDPTVKLNEIEYLDTPLSGMAARLFTESAMLRRQCVVLLYEHRPIRAELHGVIELYSALAQLVPLPVKQEECVMKSFKKLVPINSRVPLYS